MCERERRVRYDARVSSCRPCRAVGPQCWADVADRRRGPMSQIGGEVVLGNTANNIVFFLFCFFFVFYFLFLLCIFYLFIV